MPLRIVPLMVWLLVLPVYAQEAVYKENEDAVREVEKAGGKVTRGLPQVPKPGVPEPPTQFDPNNPDPVVEVLFQGSSFNDAALKKLIKTLCELKHLEKIGFTNTGVTDDGLKNLIDVTYLNALLIGPGSIKGPGLQELASLHFLNTIEVPGHNLSDAGYEALKSIPYLQRLNLNKSKTTDADMKLVAAVESLMEVDLDETTVTDAGLMQFSALKNLRFLNLNRTKITGSSFKSLPLDNLAGISAFAAPITDTSLAHLTECQTMEQLYLGTTKVTDAGMKHIAKFTGLQQLELSGLGVTNAGLKEIAGLKELKKLFLTATKVTDAGLPDLAEMKQLELLTVSRNPRITSAAGKHLAVLTSLKHLEIASTKFGDPGLNELIAPLQGMNYLDISDTLVGDGAAKAKAYTDLEFLGLSGTKANDTVVNALGSLKKLQQLHLARTPITLASYDTLHTMDSLRHLDLTSTKMVGPKLMELRVALPYTRILPAKP